MSAEFFRRLSRTAEVFVTRCSFHAVAAVAAQAHGVDVADLYAAPDPNAVRHDRGDARRISLARSEALYMTVVRLGRSQRSASRALGLSQPAVHKSVTCIEERREDPQFDRMLDEFELELMGDAA